MYRTCMLAALLTVATQASLVLGQVTYEEADGIRYQVSRQTTPRAIDSVTYEPREYTTYRNHYTTDMQEVQRTYMVPITEQQWVPGYERSLNIFAPPVFSYRMMPVTRWEARTETVRVPVTKHQVIPEQRTAQVPVVKRQIVNDTHEHRVAVGVSGNGGSMASVPSGTRMSSDPPRASTSSSTASGTNRWQGNSASSSR